MCDRINNVAAQITWIGGEFDRAAMLADDCAPALGSPQLAAMLTAFASNWSIHRERLTADLRELAGLADAGPVPGDPREVAALGRRFQATADEIASAVRRLRACADESWNAGAGEAFRRRSAETAVKLAAAYDRYAAVAIALGTDPGDPRPSTAARPNYAAALAQAQNIADPARAARLRDDAAANASRLISRVINTDALGDSWRDYVMAFIDEQARLLSVTAQAAGQLAAAYVTVALKMGGVGDRPEPAPDVTGYELTLPEGWFRIDPRSGVRAPALASVAGRDLYVSPQTAGGFPLPAALVVTRTRPHDEPRVVVHPRRLAEVLADEGGDVTVTCFPAGQAVRVRRGTTVTSLDIHFPVPDTGAYLVLSFAAPLDELADAMVTRFDSIASTLKWTP